MKPPRRPGKVITSGRIARAQIAKAKPLSPSQLQHLQPEENSGQMSSKAGRGGKRAKWKLDYEEGVDYDRKHMPYKECDAYSQDGVRKLPKNQH